MGWIVLLGLAAAVYLLHKLIIYILNDRHIVLTETKRILLGWGIAIFVFVPYFVHMEQTKIKDGGTYYVNLFPDDETTKNYRVPGLIYSDEYGYHLYEVYWPNGGTLSFDRSSPITDLIVGKKVFAEDDEGDGWYIELTKEKAIVD